MTTFRIFSDLHLEFLNRDKLVDFIDKSVLLQEEHPVDYLILAGDITIFDEKFKLKDFLIKNTNLYQHIFYIVGNHEFYSNSQFEKDLFKHSNNEFYKNVIKEFNKICSSFDNVSLLNNDFLEIQVGNNEKIVIYGSPMWTPVNKETYNIMNDRLSLEQTTILEEHNNSIKEINDFFEMYKDKDVKKIIITHHLPLEELVDEKFKNYFKYNSGFASNVGKEIIDKYKIDYWIYGHTHIPSKRKINNTIFLCNPFGYPSENGHYKAGFGLTFFRNYDMVFTI